MAWRECWRKIAHKENSVKYLFINVLAGSGSTGRIVAETCRDLMAHGHECLIGYGRGQCSCPDIPCIRIGSDLDNKINAGLNRIFDNAGFGTESPTRKFLQQVKAYDPDVIWLHNLHGYYLHVGLLFDYLRTCGKQIFWTLHDCWAMTGHCAYFDYVGCDRYEYGCDHCPEKKQYPASFLMDGSRRNYQKKKDLFTGIPQMHLIVPSNWLMQRVKRSFLKDYPVEVRYNTVNQEIFKPSPSHFRSQYHLEDKKILLGVASVWDRRKGLDDFLSLQEMLDDRYQIVLVGLNPEQMKTLPREILALPRTKTPGELAEIYSAADYYINPGVEETFGMTVLEAQRCGTTAIVYENTACAEVAELFGGIVVPRGPENLFRAVSDRPQEA